MREAQTVSAETAAPALPKPDPNACVCCGRWALAGYEVTENGGKACSNCVYELARAAGLLQKNQW